MHVLGRDVTMDSVVSLNQRDMVGKLEYIHPSREEILDWIKVSWKPLTVNLHRVLNLVDGLLVFKFLSVEGCKAIESMLWVLGEGSLVLSCWNSNFDPWKEKLACRPLSVLLLESPLQCWNMNGFAMVGKFIGHFILV